MMDDYNNKRMFSNVKRNKKSKANRKERFKNVRCACERQFLLSNKYFVYKTA